MKKLKVSLPSIPLSEKDEAFRTEVFWEEFKDVAIEAFEIAVKKATSDLSFFPKPVELWGYIKPVQDLTYWPSFTEIEHKEEALNSEQVKECLKKIYESIGTHPIKIEGISPYLKGEEGKRFEEKRRIAKEKLKKDIIKYSKISKD
jgi:hypothetical protein